MPSAWYWIFLLLMLPFGAYLAANWSREETAFLSLIAPIVGIYLFGLAGLFACALAFPLGWRLYRWWSIRKLTREIVQDLLATGEHAVRSSPPDQEPS
jgi:hypothetical protein